MSKSDTPIVGGLHIFPAHIQPGDLYAFRAARGLSQVKLARKLGCSHTAIGRWERGEAVPQDRFQQAMKRLLRA